MGIALTRYFYFARALRSRPFALLWLGQTISALGDGAYLTALAWQVLILTHSASAMGVIVGVNLIPQLLFLLIGGVAADRLPQRTIMILSDIARFVIVCLVAVLGWVQLLQVWHLVVLTLFFGFVRGFFTPAYLALRPRLAQKEDLPSVNALTALSKRTSMLLGAPLGALCVSLAGPALAFFFDGLSFAFSAVCLFAIYVPVLASNKPAAAQEVTTDDAAVSKPKARRAASMLHHAQGVIVDIREGFSYIVQSTWLWVSILVASLVNIGMVGSSNVALPKLIQDSYGSGVWLLGILTTANAIGAISANLLIGQLSHVPRRGLLGYLALILSNVALIAFGVPLPHGSEPIVSTIANVLVGFGVGVFGVIWETVLQELVPHDKLGRVSSIDLIGSLGLLPLGYVFAGLLTDSIGPQAIFVGSGVINLVLLIAALCVRDIRNLR